MSDRRQTAPKPRNVARLELRTPKYRIRVVKSHKVYTRKLKHKDE